jgi:hypothetical protein
MIIVFYDEVLMYIFSEIDVLMLYLLNWDCETKFSDLITINLKMINRSKPK